jgi:hypothetical protein
VANEQQGFFVKIRDNFYRGPFEDLNSARSEARSIGPDLSIYHGILKRISEDLIDDSELFLVPKLEKEKYI